MIRSLMLSAALISLTLVVACADDAADMRQSANKAQTDANIKIDAAQANADQVIRTAQADADSTIAAERARFIALREDYRHATTVNLADLDKKVADIEAKAQSSTGAARTTLNASLAAIRVDHDAFMKDSAALESESASGWDAARERLDAEWKNLSNRVDEASR